jgi:pseudaminic acid biosynthesis-associated methylase
MTLKTSQLDAWTGEFGEKYIERNSLEDWKIPYGMEAFRRMLGGVSFESILEVGSNVGLNLHFISNITEGRTKLYAVEPNKKAFEMLISSQNGLKLEKAFNCDAFKIPLADESIDLVFTAGVLIHIHPNDLLKAMSEIVRVSKRYVLCMEYFSHQPEEILYRGQKGLLFKRDFGSFYLDNFPQLKCLNYGFLWKKEFPIFDDMTWWLFEKIQL